MTASLFFLLFIYTAVCGSGISGNTLLRGRDGRDGRDGIPGSDGEGKFMHFASPTSCESDRYKCYILLMNMMNAMILHKLFVQIN